MTTIYCEEIKSPHTSKQVAGTSKARKRKLKGASQEREVSECLVQGEVGKARAKTPWNVTVLGGAACPRLEKTVRKKKYYFK